MMGWKILATVAVLSAASTATAAAATPHWQVSALPLPAGLEGSSSTVVAHDGHGGYTATVGAPQGEVIVTWRDGEPTEHDLPAGQQYLRVWGESRDDTLLLGTLDHQLLTLDDSGYHPVSTAQFTMVEWAVLGPHGDILVMADAADGSTSVQHSTLADPGAWQPLAGVTPGSEPIAVDDDGAVLVNDPDGSYVLRDGVVQRLTAPEGPAAYPPSGGSIKHGVVVGTGFPTQQGATQALKWTAPGTAPQVLDRGVGATDVNSHGVVVGTDANEAPLAWVHGTAATDLPLPAGKTVGIPVFIDDDGTIVGNVTAPLEGLNHAVVWRH